MISSLCKNCGREFEGNYCPNCGQKMLANQRLNFTEVVKDFFDNTFNLHKGFFFTFWKLITSPGLVSKSYINGMRKKFTNPTRYLVIALAVLTLGDWILETNSAIQNEDFTPYAFFSEKLNRSFSQWNIKLVTEYALLSNLFEVMIFPFGFYWVFRKLKYNYTELLTVSFYYVSNSIFVTFIILILSRLVMGQFASVEVVISFIVMYYFWALSSFFKEIPLMKRLLLIALGMIIFWGIRGFILPLVLAFLFP